MGAQSMTRAVFQDHKVLLGRCSQLELFSCHSLITTVQNTVVEVDQNVEDNLIKWGNSWQNKGKFEFSRNFKDYNASQKHRSTLLYTRIIHKKKSISFEVRLIFRYD